MAVLLCYTYIILLNSIISPWCYYICTDVNMWWWSPWIVYIINVATLLWKQYLYTSVSNWLSFLFYLNNWKSLTNNEHDQSSVDHKYGHTIKFYSNHIYRYFYTYISCIMYNVYNILFTTRTQPDYNVIRVSIIANLYYNIVWA